MQSAALCSGPGAPETDRLSLLLLPHTPPVPCCVQAVDFVRARLAAGRSLKEVCEDVCDRCLAPDTGGCGKGCDNMSVVVALLKDYAK